MQNSVTVDLKGERIALEQVTDFPWNGRVLLKINSSSSKPFEMALRIPGFARNEVLPGNLYAFADNFKPEYSIKINGKKVKFST